VVASFAGIFVVSRRDVYTWLAAEISGFLTSSGDFLKLFVSWNYFSVVFPVDYFPLSFARSDESVPPL
jgi:hypothetical protein